MVYVDTSLAVALLAPDVHSAAALAWMESNTAPLVSADWLAVEFASAIAAGLRAKALRPAQARLAHEAFDALTATGLRLLPVSRNAYREAARLCAAKDSRLRAGDALHLAVAVEAGAKGLAGFDDVMNAAAEGLGLEAVL